MTNEQPRSTQRARDKLSEAMLELLNIPGINFDHPQPHIPSPLLPALHLCRGALSLLDAAHPVAAPQGAPTLS